MQASTMMGMSPRLICCSCNPVPPPPAAPPMAAFHAAKSSRPSPCRYRVLRPKSLSHSELQGCTGIGDPGAQESDFPETPAGGSSTLPRWSLSWALSFREVNGYWWIPERRAQDQDKCATFTCLSPLGPNALSCLECLLQGPYLWESLGIVMICITVTTWAQGPKVHSCQARSLSLPTNAQ